MRLRFASRAAIALLVVAAACGGDEDGTTEVDARPRTDAAIADAQEPDGQVEDAASPDAASPDAMSADAAVDAMPTNSELIGFARATADGTGLTLPIVNAVVTYLKPALGNNDPAGFTIQIDPTGPALFIAVDPTMLTPPPVVGTVASFTITSMSTISRSGNTGPGLRAATAITGYTPSAPVTVEPLVQNISTAIDVVTMLDSYESELIDVTGTIAAPFIGAGTGFEQAQISTTGLTGNASYGVRLPTTLRDGLDLVQDCSFSLNNVPVHRFASTVQLPAYVAGDITVSNCPAPTVVSAVALSATSVQVTLSRRVLETSLLANGAQFTFDNGLTASAATVSGRVVTLTTSAQTGGTTYTVNVASTVTDLQGTALGTPATATFDAFVTPAVVLINELNANITGGCDLIELRVVSGGALTGFKIQERTGGTDELSFTLGSLSVATNAIIVLHVGPASCNVGSSPNETVRANEHLAATFTSNFDNAYDWYVGDNGLTSSDNVITLFNAAGTIVDAVLLSDDATGTAAAASETAAATVAAASQWRNDDDTVSVYVDDVFSANAVLDLNGTGNSRTGTTIQRLNNTDNNKKADWTTGAGGAATWGDFNSGQSLFPAKPQPRVRRR